MTMSSNDSIMVYWVLTGLLALVRDSEHSFEPS